MDVRVVVVEDDPSVLKDTLCQVKALSHFSVVATCESIDQALEVIPTLKPDVLLLDINLGDGTAFDLLQELRSGHYKIIFLTAHEQHAIKAIKYGALDYLLKPLDPRELSKALGKVTAALPASKDQIAVAGNQYLHKQADRIVLHSQQFLQVIEIPEIIYCQGNSGYTTFFLTGNRKVVTSKHLQTYEDLLSPSYFIRVHQSYLVNSRQIERFYREGWLEMKDGSKVPVSTRRRDSVNSFLSRKS